MRIVEKFETFDNKLHDTEGEARRHLEKIYGEKLSAIAHGIVKLEKYTKVLEYIDTNLAAFVELHTIGRDFGLVSEDKESE